MDLEPLSPIAVCLRCGTTRPTLAFGAPTCCDDFALLSVWTIATSAPAELEAAAA